MKNRKGKKPFFIVCGIIIATGIVVTIVGVGMGATAASIRNAANRYGGVITWVDDYEVIYHYDDYDDYKQHRQGDNQTNTKGNVYKDVRNINIDIDRGHVLIKTKEGIDGVEVVNTGKKRYAVVEYEADDRELNIETNDERWLDWKSDYTASVTIYIPKDYQFDSADIEVAAGLIDVEEIKGREIDISVQAGEVNVSSFQADDLDVSAKTGSIVAKGSVSHTVDMEGDIGEIDVTLSGKPEDFNYDLQVGIGQIRLDGKEYSGIANKVIANEHASKYAEIECGIGTVMLKFR